jgi:hypothetical protein
MLLLLLLLLQLFPPQALRIFKYRYHDGFMKNWPKSQASSKISSSIVLEVVVVVNIADAIYYIVGRRLIIFQLTSMMSGGDVLV